MLAFQRGDRRAFDALFARYTPRVLTFLTRMVRDRGRAEELTQDVFVRIYNAAARYEPRARFSTYVFGIAHNLALNELARAHRKYEQVDERSRRRRPAPTRAPAPRSSSTASACAGGSSGRSPTLPERQRAALVLRSEQDLDYDEIAETLETTVSSVKSLLHRAREAVLAALAKEDA